MAVAIDFKAPHSRWHNSQIASVLVVSIVFGLCIGWRFQKLFAHNFDSAFLIRWSRVDWLCIGHIAHLPIFWSRFGGNGIAFVLCVVFCGRHLICDARSEIIAFLYSICRLIIIHWRNSKMLAQLIRVPKENHSAYISCAVKRIAFSFTNNTMAMQWTLIGAIV